MLQQTVKIFIGTQQKYVFAKYLVSHSSVF